MKKKCLQAKIVVLGHQGVGKTSLIVRYISNVCTKEIAPTIGASFFTCKVSLEDINVKMQVWDTAGQERFRAMAPMYYRNANAAFLVFDISKYNSFLELKGWVQELQRNVQEPMVLSLIGNKIDLEGTRSVSREEAFLYASSIGGNYFETSAIRDQGIEQVFITTALGLIRLSRENTNSLLKRYESTESIYDANSLTYFPNENSIEANAMPIELHSTRNVELFGTGRLETASWSIDSIAHGDEQRSWCCY